MGCVGPWSTHSTPRVPISDSALTVYVNDKRAVELCECKLQVQTTDGTYSAIREQHAQLQHRQMPLGLGHEVRLAMSRASGHLKEWRNRQILWLFRVIVSRERRLKLPNMD